MSFLNGIFVQREKERQALRDEKRDAFFADYAAPRLKDPFALEIDPAVQSAKVQSLMDINLGLHDGNTSGLLMLKAEVSGLGFGLPTLPIGNPQQVRLQDVMPEGMLASNFSMGWAGWFDDN